MDIYWIQDKQRRGPATVPDVISLVQMGEITRDTLGWHAGCQGWKPLCELPALADFLNDMHNHSKGGHGGEEVSSTENSPAEHGAEGEHPETDDTLHSRPLSPKDSHAGAEDSSLPLPPVPPRPLSETAGIPGKGGKVQQVYLPRPIVRLVARFVDCGLYATLLMGLFYVFHVPFSEYLLPTNSLFWAPLILIEAYCLSRWRTTPGKSLFGISIRPFDEQEWGFSRALSRSISVFILGMGMFLPLIAGIVMLVSYFFLTRKGICLWDARILTLPTMQKPAPPSRLITGIILILFTFQLTSFFMQPWMPAMMQMIEQSSPETSQMLQKFFPAESAAPPGGQDNKNDIPQPLS